jgi:hypothetical protein
MYVGSRTRKCVAPVLSCVHALGAAGLCPLVGNARSTCSETGMQRKQRHL